MRLMLQVALTAFLSYIVEQWLLAWAIVICASIVAMCIQTTHTTAFLGGFIAISLLWMAKAAVIDVRTHSILSTKIAPLLGFQSPIVLILLTGLLGGILGGLGAMSGHQLRELLYSTKKGNFYHA